MRIPSFVFLLCNLMLSASAQTADRPVTLDPGLGTLTHPVSTTNVQAQAFFDQGLRYLYAFNHEESVRSFLKAAELDPALAMAHWGAALALGPNINIDVDPDHEKQAFSEIQKAIALKGNGSDEERDLIDALALRYSADPKADLRQLSIQYHDSMKRLAAKYPDDLDLAVLYAESGMDLRPWKFWQADGKPAEGTEEIVATLESVLKRRPNHVGANHYYIHAVEASPHPERGLPSAIRLQTLTPAAGHLVHMPSHIFARTGDYELAAEANRKGIKADEEYVRQSGGQNLYTMVYYSHNYQFLTASAMMEGRFAEARNAADQVVLNVGPMITQMPMVEELGVYPAFVLLRFGRYAEILQQPEPKEGQQIKALWRFARGVAYAATGKPAEAEKERQVMLTVAKTIPPDTPAMLNLAKDVLALADAVLQARIAETAKKPAVDLWRKAVELQDQQSYDEPADFYYPVRESLGGALLRAGDAAGAEKVFRDDLERNPRNPRSLFGLMNALEMQAKKSGASEAKRDFDEAWANADSKLTIAGL